MVRMKAESLFIFDFSLPNHFIRDFQKGPAPIFSYAGARASYYFYNTQAGVDVFSEVIKEIQKFFAV